MVSSILYFHLNMTGDLFISSKYCSILFFSSSMVSTLISRSIVLASLLNSISTKLSLDPCFAMKTNSNLFGTFRSYSLVFVNVCTLRLSSINLIFFPLGYGESSFFRNVRKSLLLCVLLTVSVTTPLCRPIPARRDSVPSLLYS